MRSSVGSLLLLAVVLAIPIVPFVVWGRFFEGPVAAWHQSAPHTGWLVVGVVGILACDIVLPVPSGPVSTLAGAQLGAPLGTLASWTGMTLGAVVAYALVKRWGRPIAERFANREDLQRMAANCQRHDVAMLLVTRPLPIFAEACVLLVGLLGTPWRRFLPAVAVSNLAIAAIYSVLGDYAAEQSWLPAAVCLSLAVPVVLAMWWRRHLAIPPPAG